MVQFYNQIWSPFFKLNVDWKENVVAYYSQHLSRTFESARSGMEAGWTG